MIAHAGRQQAEYWYTITDCARLLRCSTRTIERYLRFIPIAERCMVTARTLGTRRTRYWRISPAGLKILGHRTGLAPYL